MEKGDLPLFCAHCNISLENGKGLSTIPYGDEVIPVCDALAYLLGISVQDFLELSTKCDLTENSSRCPSKGQEGDEVLVCHSCVPLLSEFYKTHQLFQSAIHPSSFVVRLKENNKFRNSFKSKSPPPPVQTEIKTETVFVEDKSSYFSPANVANGDCEDDLFETFNFEDDDAEDGQWSDVDVEEKLQLMESLAHNLTEVDSSVFPSKPRSTTIIKELVIKLKRLSSEYLREKYGIRLENVKNEDSRSVRPKSEGKSLRCRKVNKVVQSKKKCKSGSSNYEEEYHSDLSYYKCDTCGKQYKKKQMYEEHLLTHQPNFVPLPCPKCGKSFQLKSNLQTHMAYKHNNSKEDTLPCECRICDTKVKGRRALWKHMREAHANNSSIPCKVCGKTFTNRLYIFQHLRQVHGVGEKKSESERKERQICEICGNAILCYLMKAHLKRVHSLPCDRGDLKTENFQPRPPKRLQDKQPRKPNGHFLPSVEKWKSDLSKISIRRIRDKFGPNGEPGPWKCEHCDKVFTHYTCYKYKHLPKHYRDKELECRICGEKFKGGKTPLWKHMRAAHPDHTPCNICGKTFNKRSNLLTHIRIEHEEEGSGKKTEKIAKKTEPVIVMCELCGKGLRGRNNLQKHIKMVHSDLSYKCDTCGKQYKKKRIYDEHMLTHEPDFVPLLCPQCGKSFQLKSNLQTHMSYEHHSKGNAFACEFCPSTFPSQSYLDTHKFCHSAERHFKCECGKAFQRPSQLKNHKRQKHHTDDC